MSGTSESEIRHLMRDLGIIDKFLGTFDRRFDGFVRQFAHRNSYKTAIVNTGYREQGGIHWLALAWDPYRRVIHIFDPLGWKDKQLSRYYDGFSYDRMIKNTAGIRGCITARRVGEAVQCSCSGACGLFCVMFLYAFDKCPSCPEAYWILDRMKGETPALKPRHWRDLHRNQRLLYRFLYANSQYFREHYDRMEKNTRLDLLFKHE